MAASRPIPAVPPVTTTVLPSRSPETKQMPMVTSLNSQERARKHKKRPSSTKTQYKSHRIIFNFCTKKPLSVGVGNARSLKAGDFSCLLLLPSQNEIKRRTLPRPLPVSTFNVYT